ncbi:hypothetical protein N7481_002384 [Penicillium waksmanii]|uniref:uncharacterized protein n=1 Tax=Penicillium waksmanii TaxID=69791 RepID=UPI0025475076|nr:uncharacterized protein N7481_002384 [Penicillium waksmanii]KAJ5995407.1 hypothetical protein N7481_002384 [Penicillium waksmanii]
MAESRESQHSLLPEEDLVNARPARSWNPLGRSESPSLDYHHIPSPSRTFSNEVFRDVGLGITNPSGETLPVGRSRRDSVSSTDSQADTPGFLKTPETPAVPHSPNCPSHRTILQRRLSWVPITILVLAFYATIFSGIYLIVAFWKPRWDIINDKQALAPSTANLLCAFFAKTIELAYVTICVAFLGQVLSRRALTRDSRGISIADMSMRAWIMQPGSMIVHWETLRYSGLTILGTIALVATFVAMLYTTAAEALVSPKLSMGSSENRTLAGKVQSSFANTHFLASVCQTPIPLEMDPVNRNNTCLEIEHVSSAYHNYQQWITEWSDLVQGDNRTSDKLHHRRNPSGSIWDNTTVTGSWIEVKDTEELSSKYSRMVNNITMAMPHGGIPGAAMDGRNDIKQPKDASGEGKYNLEAMVPSPAVNVLCVGMNKSELSPIVYTEWPDSDDFNATSWMASPSDKIPVVPSWLNSTVVDDIFGFGKKYGQRPPIFGKFPETYNTILNITGPWPADSIYLLGKPNVSHPPYVMCSIRAKLTGACSTSYSAASSGAFLTSKCEDPDNTFQYNRDHPDFGEGRWDPDWKNIASEWANSLSLGAGITDGAASNARLLMQMMPSYDESSKTYSLSRHFPSIGEALAVMAGSTLILSTRDTPFVQGWNYNVTDNILPEPVYHYFKASVQAVGYASGGTERWQGVFYVILIFCFITSFICFGFMILEARGHQITDFTEPQNLFALAMNSPHSARLHGACGGGPVGRQLKERWFIGMEEDDAHYYIRAKADGKSAFGSGRSTAYRAVEQMDMDDSSLKPVSPAVNEFRRVSKRGSFLAKFY